MARRFYLLDMWISVERFFSLFDGERESLCRLESRDVVFRDDDGRVFGNVACSFGGTFLEDKTTKAAKINVLFIRQGFLYGFHERFNSRQNDVLFDSGLGRDFFYDICLSHDKNVCFLNYKYQD